MSLLEIENLSLMIGATSILKGVDLAIAPGEVVGLVGESGSGKSMTALTIMQLLPHLARTEGRVAFNGIDILGATEDQMCALRGDDIGIMLELEAVIQPRILCLDHEGLARRCAQLLKARHARVEPRRATRQSERGGGSGQDEGLFHNARPLGDSIRDKASVALTLRP